MSESVYPGAIDSYTLSDVQSAKVIKSQQVRQALDEGIAIENTLGLNPQGAYPTVVDRLDAVDSSLGNYVLKTGDTMTGTLIIDNANLNVGTLNTVSGDYAVGFGVNVTASGDYSSAEGEGTTASEEAAHAEGISTEATAEGSHSEGISTHATDSGAHAEGINTNATNSGSHAEGYDTHADGDASHAEGTSTYALTGSDHAEGQSTTAAGGASHAEGQGATTYATASHAESNAFIAGIANQAHAEANSYAVGTSSHAEGDGETYGDRSHAESSVAAGQYTHAEGRSTYAVGAYSHTEGNSTKTSKYVDTIDIDSGGTTGSIGGDWVSVLNANPTVLLYGLFSNVIFDAFPNYYGLLTNIAYDNMLFRTTFEFNGNTLLGGDNGSAYIAFGGLGDYAHAEGRETIASGSASHAEGLNTEATGPYAHAEGNASLSTGEASHAGGFSYAFGPYSSAQNYSEADGTYAHAEGFNTYAIGNSSHSEGNNTLAGGNDSHAEGNGAYAVGPYSHAEGLNTEASAGGSHAEGLSGRSPGIYSHSEGQNTVAVGAASHAEGYNTKTAELILDIVINPLGLDGYAAGGDYSTILSAYPTISLFSGFNFVDLSPAAANVYTLQNIAYDGMSNITTFDFDGLTPIGPYPGNATIAVHFNNNAHAEGTNSKAYNQAAHAEGISTEASGAYSHAEGQSSEAAGQASHAEGNNTHATADYSHAEGLETYATQQNAHAEGYGTTATAFTSHAEGYYTIASGYFSHAENFKNTASGWASHAEGGMNGDTTQNSTTASGYSSHAEGAGSTASGDYSHAGGQNSVADGTASFAHGIKAQTGGYNGTVSLTDSQAFTTTNESADTIKLRFDNGLKFVKGGGANNVDGPEYAVIQNSTQTTNGSWVTIQTIPTVTDSVVLVEARVLGLWKSGSSGAAGDSLTGVHMARITNVAGTATLKDDTSIYKDKKAGYDMRIIVSSPDILVQVQGATNENLDWHTTTKVQRLF